MVKKFHLLALAVLILPGTVFAAACGTTPSPATTATSLPPAPETPGPAVSIIIEDFAYSPATLKVAVGTTVTWTNKDSVGHTVTARTPLFNSGLLSRGQSFGYTFRQKGDYEYYCIPHPYMTGKVSVE